jgi:hypothetical protein
MLSDSRALDPGAIEFIRHESLKVGAELALQYLSTLDQRLRAGRKLSVEQLRTAIDSLIIAMQAGISSEFETHISTLKQLRVWKWKSGSAICRPAVSQKPTKTPNPVMHSVTWPA